MSRIASLVLIWVLCMQCRGRELSLVEIADVRSDPDAPLSGFEFSGVAGLKVGDRLAVRRIRVGGFGEFRNEKRFNQGILPNHNWRGGLYARGLIWQSESPDVRFGVSGGAEHESAHPSMGIRKDTDAAYELIYDDQYRRMVLNSILVRGVLSVPRQQWFVRAVFDYQFYIRSKNTPEAACMNLTESQGLALGVEVFRKVKHVGTVYLSVFDRVIFDGFGGTVAEVCFGNGDQLVSDTVAYAIVRSVNTVTSRVGFALRLPQTSREVDVFAKVLYGNIFGFVDSRERRLVFSVGVQLGHPHVWHGSLARK